MILIEWNRRTMNCALKRYRAISNDSERFWMILNDWEWSLSNDFERLIGIRGTIESDWKIWEWLWAIREWTRERVKVGTRTNEISFTRDFFFESFYKRLLFTVNMYKINKTSFSDSCKLSVGKTIACFEKWPLL
jgi:hypothetical protein